MWGKRSKNDIDEEIRSHLAIEADQLRGERSRDADDEARRRFGNVTKLEEDLYEQGRWLWWDHLSRDLRLALRLLRRRPGFTATVVLTLALGIGASTAIFSVIDAVLLKPLPYRDPGRLAMLWSEDPAHGLKEGRVSLPNIVNWKARNHAFQSITMYLGQTFLLGSRDGNPERRRSYRVDSDFFQTLGVEPVLGRVFTKDEVDRAEPVVVLSYGLWQQRFAGSPQALGSDLIMDGRKRRIVGVMPASFQLAFGDTALWEPMTIHPYWSERDRKGSYDWRVWHVMGRLRDETTWSEAQAEMSGIAQQNRSNNIAAPEIRVVPLKEQTTGGVQAPLAILFGAVFLMLLIACINAANLLLARGSSREREFAVRRALGAGRKTLAAQLFVESLVLSLNAGAVGLLLANILLKALIAYAPKDIPRLDEARMNLPVLLFALLASVLAAVFSGIWPAFKETVASRSRQWSTLADRGLRNTLVIGEFAITLVLLAGAGLLMHSFLKLQAVDPGFRPDDLLLMRIDLHVGKTRAQQLNYFQNAIARVANLPGVQSAGAGTAFLRSDPEEAIELAGLPLQRPGPCLDSIEGAYFETAGIPVKRGRLFNQDDRDSSLPVAIVNEAMARTYWPNQDPIGKQFRVPRGNRNPWFTVVGVTGDMHRQGVEKSVIPQMFVPLAQEGDNMLDVIVRTTADPAAIAQTVRQEIESIDRTVARFDVTTIEQQLAEERSPWRFQTSLIGLFSLAALLLSAMGIYGLMHYFVVERGNEIGVRMALGARSWNVVAMVLKQGLRYAVIGILIGLAGALALTRLLGSLLYGVTPGDPAAFGAAIAALLLTAALACAIPARNAARIDPVIALRQD